MSEHHHTHHAAGNAAHAGHNHAAHNHAAQDRATQVPIGHAHAGHTHPHAAHGDAHHGHVHHEHAQPGGDRIHAHSAAPAPFSLLLAGLSRRLALALCALALLWPVTFWALR